MKTYYLEKKDKPKFSIKKYKIEQDELYIYINLEKIKNIKKIIKKLQKDEVTNVVLSKNLYKNVELINILNANNIKIFNGRWLEKYLAIEVLEYIINKKCWKKEKTDIAITVNEITDLNIETIKILANQYKRINVITNHIEKLKKIEKEIYNNTGVIIVVSNNIKKSLAKSTIILNFDFNKRIMNRYKINENAIIVNLEGDMKIKSKRFNGININDYEIVVGREEIIWRENMYDFKTKDLLEANLYVRDTFQNICKRINKNKVSIKEVFGENGKIERFY